MADIVDIGNEAAEAFLEKARAERKVTGPKANGRCHNCGKVFPTSAVYHPSRWCDVECRDDWELMERKA